MPLGRILYHCYHRPKTWWQDLCDQHAGQRGEADMRRAAGELPVVPLATLATNFPACRFLTGAKFVHQTIFCARSFEWALAQKVRIEIFSDGSLTTDDRRQIERVLPHATIADDAEVVERLDRVLPRKKFPFLRAMRDTNLLMRKLLDLRAGLPEPAMSLDSDMLFFRGPDILCKWLHSPAGNWFMQQEGDALTGERHQLGRVLGAELLPGVNSGIVALDGRQIDWDSLEKTAGRLVQHERDHKWAEQTLFAFLLSQRRAQPLPISDYVLCHNRTDLSEELPILRHYVHKSKALYTAYEWRRWLQLSRFNSPLTD